MASVAGGGELGRSSPASHLGRADGSVVQAPTDVENDAVPAVTDADADAARRRQQKREKARAESLKLMADLGKGPAGAAAAHGATVNTQRPSSSMGKHPSVHARACLCARQEKTALSDLARMIYMIMHAFCWVGVKCTHGLVVRAVQANNHA